MTLMYATTTSVRHLTEKYTWKDSTARYKTMILYGCTFKESRTSS